jgi:acyl-CoA synthetase (AMP-forming)/AMP-acid ligase II
MNPLRAQLAQASQPDLLLSEHGSLNRLAVLSAADSLQRALTATGARRCLLQSGEAADLLIALVGCQDAGADLVLAHANLPPEQIQHLGTTLDVDTILSARARGVLAARKMSAGPPQGNARIFLMTSGTTGLPKVVEHQYERLVGRIAPSAQLQANRQARWLLTYQPTAFAGVQVLLTACLTDGVAIEAERTPAGFAAAAERYQSTHISGTPTFWRAFLMACEPARLPHLRQITLGGEAIDQTTLDRLARAFPSARVTQIYASSEAGSLLAVSDGRCGFPADWLGQEVQGVRLRIRDGILEVFSPRSMVGYHALGHAPPTTEDGWLVTGDRVRVEGDRIIFLGRRDAMINVGGAKVFPQEVEAFLLSLPDVAEARVQAARSPITGQVLVAQVVVAPGAAHPADQVRLAVLQACRQRLPRHQVPARIEVVPAIPVAESGKKQGDAS